MAIIYSVSVFIVNEERKNDIKIKIKLYNVNVYPVKKIKELI